MTEPSRKVVSSFEDWTERVKGEVILKRPDAELVIPIRAISEAERAELRQVYIDLMPARPKLSKDRSGEVRANKVNEDAVAKYEEEKAYANAILQMLYIEKGCDWEIPGKNNSEKLESLKSKVAGEIDILYKHIVRISRLSSEDIDFF